VICRPCETPRGVTPSKQRSLALPRTHSAMYVYIANFVRRCGTFRAPSSPAPLSSFRSRVGVTQGAFETKAVRYLLDGPNPLAPYVDYRPGGLR
jgi:hypothetical protein